MTNLPIAARLAALGRCEVFGRIPSEAVAVLAEIVEVETLATDELLFEQGEPSERVFVVVSGALAISVSGRVEPVRSLPAGSLLGEYGLFASGARTASARAEGPTTVLSLDYERFRAFLLQFPEATLSLLATAVARLVEAERT